LTGPSIQQPTQVYLNVRLERADVVQAALALFFRRAKWMIIVWDAAFVAVVVVVALDWPKEGLLARPLGIAALVLVMLPVLVIGALFWSARRQFERASSDPQTIRYHFCADGLDVGSQKRAGWLPWEAFSGAVETGSAFLLFLTPGEHYLLPKRCFDNSSDVDAVRRLLRQELGSRARLSRGSG
jgi:hypothetical protein